MQDNLFEWARKYAIPTDAVLALMDMMDPTRFTPTQETALSSESAVQAALRLKASTFGVTLWRNNSGVLKDERGTPVRFGLANDSAKVNKNFKSADLIGIWPRHIEQKDVGTIIGQFAAIECKKPGWKGVKTERETGQSNFLSFVRNSGGVATFAQSVKDVFND